MNCERCGCIEVTSASYDGIQFTEVNLMESWQGNCELSQRLLGLLHVHSKVTSFRLRLPSTVYPTPSNSSFAYPLKCCVQSMPEKSFNCSERKMQISNYSRREEEATTAEAAEAAAEVVAGRRLQRNSPTYRLHT